MWLFRLEQRGLSSVSALRNSKQDLALKTCQLSSAGWFLIHPCRKKQPRRTLRAEIPNPHRQCIPIMTKLLERFSYQTLRIATTNTADFIVLQICPSRTGFHSAGIYIYTRICIYPLKHIWIDGYMFHLGWHLLSKSK